MMHRAEEFVAKVAGAAKGVKATMGGLTGVFRRLTEEHGEISTLLMRMKLSDDPGVRREMFPKIRRELLAHEQAELRELYPVFRQYRATQALAVEHDADARTIGDLVHELTALPVDGLEWAPVLDRLIDALDKHVKDEETTYFPQAQRVFGDRAGELLERYEITRAEALRELTATP